MKKNYMKSLIFLAFCASLFAALTVCASAKTVKSGNYIYDVNGTTAALVEYTGSESTVSIPEKIGSATVTKINDYAFWQNRKVVSVTFPSTVTSIGEAVFNECTALTKVVFPKDLVSLGDAVFWFCTNLKTVVFGPNVKNFGENIFTGCSKSLTAYVVSGTAAEKYIKTQKSVNLGYRYISSLKTSSSLSVALGETAKISVTISPSTVYDRRLSYSSSDTSVLTVASDGTVKPLKIGKATVTCKAKDGSGKTVKTTITVVPARAQILKQSKTTLTSYRLEWAKVTGATTYRVYRYDTSTKKWISLGYTAKTYCDLKNLAYCSSDQYRVKAYCKTGSLTYSGAASPTFTASVKYAAKVTGIKMVSSDTKKITFSWSKAANADGYNVYSYDASTKKYTLLKSTSALTYTAEKLSPNREYGFAIRAYALDGTKKVLAKEHSGRFYFSTIPSTVTGLSLVPDSVGFEQFTVKWNTSEGISGYLLSCRAADGSEKTLTLSADQTSSEFDGLLPGTGYTVTIQAYSTRRSVRYISSSSTIRVETEFIPTTADQAVSSFTKAFNTTASSRASFTLLLKQKVTPDVNNPHTVTAEKVSSAVSSQFAIFTQYNFENGTEKASGIVPGNILHPLTLTADDLDPETVEICPDQSGFRVGFALENQTPETETGLLLAPSIDTAAIEDATGLTVTCVSFVKTQVSEKYTKIQNGLFDNLKVTSTIAVTVNDGEEDIPLTFDIEQMYYFLWTL